MNNKGFILITSYMVVTFLAILSMAFLLTITSQLKQAEARRKGLQSFYLAEAGVDYAIEQLRQSESEDSVPATALKNEEGGDIGTYAVSWEQAEEANQWVIYSTGEITNNNGAVLDNRSVEMVLNRVERDFYSNVLYVDGDGSVKGEAYAINGEVVYSGNFDGLLCCQDSYIAPLEAIFDVTRLETISQSQPGNFYDAQRITEEGFDGLGQFFWYNPDQEIPNIIVIEGDLQLTPGSYGGFFVVKGNATIDGNANVEGAVYVLGSLTINGGGGGTVNIHGGAWTKHADLQGSVDVTYFSTYMDAIKKYGKDNVTLQIVSWEEK